MGSNVEDLCARFQGIGIETARALATANAHVILTARDMSRGAEVTEDIKKTTGNDQVEVMQLELDSFQSIRDFVDRFRARQLPIHILICERENDLLTHILMNCLLSLSILGNAGIMACPYSKTVDGFETQFAVNHLGHFLLTTSLLPELRAGKPSRVVVVSSLANKRGGIQWDDLNWEKTYNKWLAYAQSKTANILFAKQFDQLYGAEGIHAYSLHPGVIFTNLMKHIPPEEQQAMGWHDKDGHFANRLKNVEQGASTSVFAALAPELDHHGGEYLEDCAISQGLNPDMKTLWGMAPHSMDMEAAERLWQLSEQMTASKGVNA